MSRHWLIQQLAVCAALAGIATPASASDVIRIGVLSDMSGPYSDIAGKGSVAAAELAVKELGGKVGDYRIEIVTTDHQNKLDIGSPTARKWFDREDVDVIVDDIFSSARSTAYCSGEK